MVQEVGTGEFEMIGSVKVLKVGPRGRFLFTCWDTFAVGCIV